MNRWGTAPAGFSLVEVALSLAILAVAMVGVLSLLPVGLDSARQVQAEAVMANLVRASLSDFATNGWSAAAFANITQSTNEVVQTERYTADGRPVPATAVSVTDRAYFRLEYLPVLIATNSARYCLRLAWPEEAINANPNSPLIQRRFFFTDVIRAQP